jgi:hypothetical protein
MKGNITHGKFNILKRIQFSTVLHSASTEVYSDDNATRRKFPLGTLQHFPK